MKLTIFSTKDLDIVSNFIQKEKIFTLNLTMKFTENAQSFLTKLESDEFVIIVGGLILFFLTILFNIIVQALFQLGSKISEWEYLTQIYKIVPFVLVSALVSAILLYLLYLVKVLTKIFQCFWFSLEDED